MYIVKQMTNISPSIFHGNSVAPIPPGAGKKIIQRIPHPRLSDRVKESRMADADEELVLQSQNGDPAAFEALIHNHQHMVHSLTFRMTGSLADAEDLAQETFIRAYEQIGDFRGVSKFSTWLYRIAVNTCLNWRQSEARRFQLQAKAAGEISAWHAGRRSFPRRPDKRSSGRAAQTARQTTRRHRADDLRRIEPRRGRAGFGLLGNHRVVARVRRETKIKTAFDG